MSTRQRASSASRGQPYAARCSRRVGGCPHGIRRLRALSLQTRAEACGGRPARAAASDEGQARANDSQPWAARSHAQRRAGRTTRQSHAVLATPRALAGGLFERASDIPLHSRRHGDQQGARRLVQVVGKPLHRGSFVGHDRRPRVRTGKGSRLAHRRAPKKASCVRLPRPCPRRRALVPGAAWARRRSASAALGSAARRRALAAPRKPPDPRVFRVSQSKLSSVPCGGKECAGSPASLLGPVRAGGREPCRGAVARTSVEPQRHPGGHPGRLHYDHESNPQRPFDGGAARAEVPRFGHPVWLPEQATRKHQRVAVRSLFILVAARSKRVNPPSEPNIECRNSRQPLPSARPPLAHKKRMPPSLSGTYATCACS